MDQALDALLAAATPAGLAPLEPRLAAVAAQQAVAHGRFGGGGGGGASLPATAPLRDGSLPATMPFDEPPLSQSGANGADGGAGGGGGAAESLEAGPDGGSISAGLDNPENTEYQDMLEQLRQRYLAAVAEADQIHQLGLQHLDAQRKRIETVVEILKEHAAQEHEHLQQDLVACCNQSDQFSRRLAEVQQIVQVLQGSVANSAAANPFA